MIKHSIKIGTSNFRKLVSSDGLTLDPNRLYVDKTLFIKHFLDHSNDVVLITRPRRWGKSSALSMLQHFFCKELENLPTAGLFENLKIAEYLSDPNYKKYQGTHPVILVSFKDVSGNNFKDLENSIKGLIAKLYKQYEYILQALHSADPIFKYETQDLYKANSVQFERIINKKQDLSETASSLTFLSELLRRYHGKKVFILIDEYDNAVNDLFDKPKTLAKLTKFISKLFGSCLKENDDNLEKCLITGILRVAKANIFSGLNNPTEETILDDKFSEDYGFTESEVTDLLNKAEIINQDHQAIKDWYNGYIIGNAAMYNPWSIMQCIDHNGELDTYWANSANPKIIKDLLINKSSRETKQKIRNLVKNKAIELNVDLKKQVSFDDLENNSEILWSLLVHTGYLTLTNKCNNRKVQLPNTEISLLLKGYIDNWFTIDSSLTVAANSLLIGNFDEFENALKTLFGDPAYSARIFSGTGKNANCPQTQQAKEFVYQFLIMTELRCVNLIDKPVYEVYAEIENVSIGKSRPDVLVVNHKDRICIICEIKVSFKPNEDLKEIAKNKSLAQIERNQYGKKYQAKYGYTILKLGIAFRGDNFEMAYEEQED